MKQLKSDELKQISGGTNTELLFYYTMQAMGNFGTILEAKGGVLAVSGEKSEVKFQSKGIDAVHPNS